MSLLHKKNWKLFVARLYQCILNWDSFFFRAGEIRNALKQRAQMMNERKKKLKNGQQSDCLSLFFFSH